ncbi:hypothetical protein P9D43_07005 [Neobacillus niacini]|uniref:hypothetical protein n=1 Tax=Neobacillus niacini TaxID=86668 RepID=UPI0007ABD000|nr:hypothetical protein [Neobacillus niacini]MEC1521778.1 hypothetical protein [Neobacillus niacini]
MLTVIWVLGTMLLMLLIHFLIPLGYTTKGKFFLVVLSGLLASGGLAATIAIPVWQAMVMLLVLSFFAAYLMDSRMAKSLYLTKEHLVEEIDFEESHSSFNVTKQTDKTLDIDLMDSELEISSSSSIKNTEVDIIPIDSLVEDISFLQDRELGSNNEELIEANEPEVGYLSDIENLLDESFTESHTDKVDSIDEESWLDELAELTILKDEDKETVDESQVDELVLEELFAEKEVAAATDNGEIKPKKVLELQK